MLDTERNPGVNHRWSMYLNHRCSGVPIDNHYYIARYHNIIRPRSKLSDRPLTRSSGASMYVRRGGGEGERERGRGGGGGNREGCIPCLIPSSGVDLIVCCCARSMLRRKTPALLIGNKLQSHHL